MSTQKNEHNPEPIPQLWMCDQEHGRDFPIYLDGKSTEQVYTEFRRLADQGRDVWLIHQNGVKELPDGRRITPPTDTTGSGREGETADISELPTPETNAFHKRVLDDPLPHIITQYREFARQLERQRDAARKALQSIAMLPLNSEPRAMLDRAQEIATKALLAAIDSAQRQEGR